MIFGIDINTYGSIASIIGTLISIGTLFYAMSINSKLKSQTKKVLFNTRVTVLVNELEKSTSTISRLLNDYSNNKDQIKTELARCKASISSMIPKLPIENQNEYKKIQKSINTILNGDIVDERKPKLCFDQINIFKKKQFIKNDIWDIYNELVYSSKIIDNLLMDKKIV